MISKKFEILGLIDLDQLRDKASCDPEGCLQLKLGGQEVLITPQPSNTCLDNGLKQTEDKISEFLIKANRRQEQISKISIGMKIVAEERKYLPVQWNCTD